MFLLSLLFACASSLTVFDSAETEQEKETFCATLRGEQICDFEAIDVNGDQMALSDLYGQPIVLDLSAAWCGPCIQAAVGVQAKANQLPDVTFLTVLIEDTQGNPPDVTDISDWAEGNNIVTEPVWGASRDLITSDPLALKDKLYLSGWPTFYFIDSDGKLQEYIRGYDANTILTMASDLK